MIQNFSPIAYKLLYNRWLLKLLTDKRSIAMTTLIGSKAIDFTSAAVMPDGSINKTFNLHSVIAKKFAVLVFYPLDFTFVCPSELIAIHNRMQEFEKRNAIVLGISIDSEYTHNAWRNTPIANGGIGQLNFPLIADVNHTICQSYNVEHPTAHVALRGTFVIDKQGIIRSQIVNDLPLGRNVDEFLRLLDALEFHEKQGEVCPAGWTKGKAGIKPTTDGIAQFLSDEAEQL